MIFLSCAQGNIFIFMQFTALSQYVYTFTFTHVSLEKCDNLRVQCVCRKHGHTLQLALQYRRYCKCTEHVMRVLHFVPLPKCIVFTANIGPSLHMTTTTQIRTDRYFYFMNKCAAQLIVPILSYCLVLICLFHAVRLGRGSLPIPNFIVKKTSDDCSHE